jgi:trans-2,3-dihydro-3-hydroxyanthranilate isomerase
MASYRYLHLDVFTSAAFQGNQLAVFPEPQGLTTEVMQTIAREMNFSESTFILPREGTGDVRMRIFTPGEELPMAGHPTIGSTFALALEGVIARGRSEFVFELGVGPTPVSMDWDERGLAFAWMTQALPVVGPAINDRGALAQALGIAAGDFASGLLPQVISCGLPYLMVPLGSRRAVDAVQVDRRALVRCLSPVGLDEHPVFVFTTEGDETTYSRMLAPGLGVGEDPAARMLPRTAPGRARRCGASDAQPAGGRDAEAEPHSHLDRHRGRSRHPGSGGRAIGAGRAGLPGDLIAPPSMSTPKRANSQLPIPNLQPPKCQPPAANWPSPTPLLGRWSFDGLGVGSSRVGRCAVGSWQLGS